MHSVKYVFTASSLREKKAQKTERVYLVEN